MGGQHPGLGAQGEGTAGGVLERGDTEHTWAPNRGWRSQKARKLSVESLVGFFSPVDNDESGCFQREISFSNPGHLDCDFPRKQRNSRFPLS